MKNKKLQREFNRLFSLQDELNVGMVSDKELREAVRKFFKILNSALCK